MVPDPGCPRHSPVLEPDLSYLLEVLLAHIPECFQVRLAALEEQPLKPPPQDRRRQKSTPAQAETGGRVCSEEHTKTLQEDISTHLGAARLW